MHIRLSPKWEEKVRYLRLKLLPKTLFFRTMLLIFIPLIVVQIVSVVMFFDGSWSRMGRRLSDNLASDMKFIIDMGTQEPAKMADLQKMSADIWDVDMEYYSNQDKHQVMNKAGKGSKLIIGYLEEALDNLFGVGVTSVYLGQNDSDLLVFVDTDSGLYKFTTSRKKIFSSSIFMFVVWMAGTSVLLFLVAVLFLRIQVRSIARLAEVAEDFGKGIDNKDFKPSGSSEVRKAAIAFIKMKERIQRQISERTQMLAGVSHDLRTPLTRMKLQVTMLPDGEDKKDFLSDIDEMEKMLDGYLSFVSGEGGEKSSFVDMNEMILSIINKFRNKKALIRYSTNDQVSAIQGREQALKRAVTNIIANAFRYGKTIAVKLESNNKKLNLVIEDDGPGIPKDKRDDVFKAFYRLENSRNKETGGVGLGLSIAKDIITSHGGVIELDDSELGGLKVLISIPL
ncbi:MAG: two-component sensor histidine kinase [Alphaproteobacteria bacterium]|nr:two-component sensor histidine kinase [Alphaproteobacteria bacterium]